MSNKLKKIQPKKRSSLRMRLIWNFLVITIISYLVLGISIEWTLFSQKSAVNFPGTMIRVAWLVVVIFIAASIFISLLAWLIGEAFLRPIEQLREAALILGQGNFHFRIAFKTNNELDDLIDSFNIMSSELERLIQEIISKQKTISRQKDEFVFIAAHELRTPVTALRWILDDLIHNSDKLSKEQTANYLAKAFSSNERLVQLVQDLLEVARSDAGKLKITMTDVKLKTTVSETISELQLLYQHKKHFFSYNPEKAGLVRADPGKLSEVLNNLISNAIKYCQNNGRIDIWHEEDNKIITTHIKDNGFGISPKDQKELFGKFFRVESDETKDIPGTGLGLFITKELVERMGGKIWLESKLGLGSIFSFSLLKSNVTDLLKKAN